MSNIEDLGTFDQLTDAADREAVLRVIDANANRAAEGLRTLEDHARLVREDRVAAEWLKRLRHQLQETLAAMAPRHARLATRSTQHDAGTQFSTVQEMHRGDLSQVVTAASERVTQSLRGLEEYSKFVSAEASQSLKQLRYATYDVLAQVEVRLNRPTQAVSARLYLLIDCQREIDDFAQYVSALAEAGVDWFQLRDKRADGGKLLRYARRAMAAVEHQSAEVLINDRVDIALASRAHGVHVGQDDLPLADVRRLVGHQMRIGVSTHSLQQAEEAQAAGADYIGCGPTFTSSTKHFDAFAGLELLIQVAAAIEIPAFAIGGIESDNLGSVLDCGCQRIAVSHAVHAAADPIAAARKLSRQLQLTPRPK